MHAPLLASVIINFRHKGLKLFFEHNDPSKLPAAQTERIRRILYRLDNAASIDELNIVGWALHPLKGQLRNFWSVKVSGNYRIIFRFVRENVFDVDYLDYH